MQTPIGERKLTVALKFPGSVLTCKVMGDDGNNGGYIQMLRRVATTSASRLP
jgi:hypothetical protein